MERKENGKDTLLDEEFKGERANKMQVKESPSNKAAIVLGMAKRRKKKRCWLRAPKRISEVA